MNIVDLKGQHIDHKGAVQAEFKVDRIEPIQAFIAGQSSPGIIVCHFFRLVGQFGLGVNVLATTSVSLWFISSQSFPAQANHRLYLPIRTKNDRVCGINILFEYMKQDKMNSL